ncbi:MAG: hypothetical protein KF774_06850 [Planctomyces sp.]|nr:hypothetical protein [Planctomyces sp.]
MSGATRPPRALRGALVCLLAASGCALPGCLARRNIELLEANLRQQQDLTRDVERQLMLAQRDLDAARRETDQLRNRLAQTGLEAAAEHTEPLARVTGILFHTMMTGGRDTDGLPGDDVLTAVLAPHDADGDLVKLAGSLEIELLDLARSGESQRIGAWKYSAKEARELWHSGFIASGYQLNLPLEQAPTNGAVLLHGRLTTSDGRQFDTSLPVNLQTGTAPAGLAPPRSARPLETSRRAPRSDSPGGPRAFPVQQAGYAVLEEDGDAASGVITASAAVMEIDDEEFLTGSGETPLRPVPMPIDLEPVPNTDGAPTSPPAPPRSEPASGQPRPFPVEGAQSSRRAAASKVLLTSDNWTDESIPYLR